MNTSTGFGLLFLALAIGGCQAHRSTPVAHTPPTTQGDLAATMPATGPTTLATTIPAPRTVAVTPATTPASTAAAPMPPQLYVAADADLATRMRNWPISTNYYPSGHVIAGPVYRINAPPPRSNKWDDVYAEDLFQTFLSVPQMIATPIWAIFLPPNTPIEYHGETFPPSYTVDNPRPYYVNEHVPGIAQMKR